MPTPRFVRLAADQQGREQTRAVPDVLGLPLIVKPPREGSSIGITKVAGYSGMQGAVELAARFDADVLCEEFIEGDELTCPVLGEGLGARALPVVRIVAPEGAYDYQNKYFTDVVRYECPCGLAAGEEAEIQRLVLAAYRTLGCRGWGRADLMLRRADRKPFLLEMNTSPGMTTHSLVPISARAAGIGYEQLCVELLGAAALDSDGRRRRSVGESLTMATTARSSTRALDTPPDVRLMNATAGVLAAIAALLLAAAASLWFARQPFFAIRVISVDGDVSRNSVSTIRANAAPRLAGNFMTLDLGAVRRAFESVPWVRHAVVQRVWPNRLRVRLEEHRPVALWAGGEAGSEKLVNSFGEVFEANVGDVEDDELPTLEGPDGSSAHVLAMLGRLGSVFAPLDAHVDALALSGRGSWQATLDSGAVIEIGRGSDEDIVTRTARFVSTVRQVTGRYQRPLEYADLRHTDGYAVRLKGVSTTLNSADKSAQKK